MYASLHFLTSSQNNVYKLSILERTGGGGWESCSTGTNGDLRKLRVKSPAQTLVTGDEKVISSGSRSIRYVGQTVEADMMHT